MGCCCSQMFARDGQKYHNLVGGDVALLSLAREGFCRISPSFYPSYDWVARLIPRLPWYRGVSPPTQSTRWGIQPTRTGDHHVVSACFRPSLKESDCFTQGYFCHLLFVMFIFFLAGMSKTTKLNH